MSAPEIRNANLNLQAVLGNANVYQETMSYHERVSRAQTKYDRRDGTAEIDDIEARIVKLRIDLNPFLEIPDESLSLKSRNAKLLLTNDIGVLERRQRQIFMDIGQEVSLQFEYPVQQITKMNFQGWSTQFLEVINQLTNSDVAEAKKLITLMTNSGSLPDGVPATEKSVQYSAAKHTAKLNLMK